MCCRLPIRSGCRSELNSFVASPTRPGSRSSDALRGGPLVVGEIVAATGLSQSNTSNHLACLNDCGLVTREQRGKYAVYALADERVAALLALADDVLADVAAAVYACTRYGAAEREPR